MLFKIDKYNLIIGTNYSINEADVRPIYVELKTFFILGPSNDKEMSKSLFNVRNREPGEIPPPSNPEMPVGRIKRLLKSNSLTAITNVNFGWRKETSV